MVMGNISHLNSFLSSLMVSLGFWVHAGDRFKGKQQYLYCLCLRLVQTLAPVGQHRGAVAEQGGRWRCCDLDWTCGGLLCCLHLAVIGPLTLMSWLNSSLPNYILYVKQCISNEDSGVEIILLF